MLFNHQKHIYTTTMPKATKFGRVVTYLEGDPLIKSHNPLNTWLRDKSKTSPLPQCLWPANLAGR